jgi:hypothetical protein
MGYKQLKDLPELETVLENDIFLIANSETPGSKITFNNMIRSMGGLLSYVKHFSASDFVSNTISVPASQMPFNGNIFLDVQIFDSVGNLIIGKVSVDVNNGDVIFKSRPFVGHLIVTGSNR